MSIHRETKISDQYEVLSYIGQGTYANVRYRLSLNTKGFFRSTRPAMPRDGYMLSRLSNSRLKTRAFLRRLSEKSHS